MPTHVKKLKRWQARWWPLTDTNATHVALFTDYPKYTIELAERQGHDFKLVTLTDNFYPFKYAFYTYT